MAKLYAELTSHEAGRIVSKSSNVKLTVTLYQNNKVIGTLKAYPIIEETNGHRVTWEYPNSAVQMIKDTDKLK